MRWRWRSILAEAGINVDAAPVLDLLHPGANAMVGDRSFGAEPMQVAALGGAMLDGLAAGGVGGVLKHMPGHGRAPPTAITLCPSSTPRAEELAADLAPFRALAEARPDGDDRAHPLSGLGRRPPRHALPHRSSATIIRGEIGFDGLLMSDDHRDGSPLGPPRRARARRPSSPAATSSSIARASPRTMRRWPGRLPANRRGRDGPD